MGRLFLKFIFFTLLLFLSNAAFAGNLQEASAKNQLQEFIVEALANNSNLKAAEASWHSFERKIIPAGSLNDPQLSFSFMNYPTGSLADDETPMTGRDIRLAQKFPFPGKLSTKKELAKAKALWFRYSYEDARLKLTAKVKKAYYQIYYFDRAVDITEKNLSILKDFIRIVETRYAVGKGLQADVLKAQVEQSKLIDRFLNLKQKRQTAYANLNYLLNRPSAAAINAIPDFAPDVVSAPVEILQKLSEDNRPLYSAYRTLIEQFQAQRKLANLDYKPDVTLWGSYRFREDVPGDPVRGEDFVSGGISLNLPIYTAKRSEAVSEANALINMARQKYDDFRRQVYFNIHDVYAQMEKNRNLIDLFAKGIIPQAEQTFQATITAYQVDKVDFLSLIDSLMKLYRYEINYYQALSDYQRNVAELEAAAGLETAELSP